MTEKKKTYRFFELVPSDLQFDWLRWAKPMVWLSGVLAAVSLVAIFQPGLNYGIDFTGGAEVHVRLPGSQDTTWIREALVSQGMDGEVVRLGEVKDAEFLVKVQAGAEQLAAVSGQVGQALDAKLAGQGKAEIKRTDVVGPKAGSNLRKSAFLSIFYALIAISIYIGFRFDTRYAPGVLRALLVDVTVVLGVWVLLGREFNLTVLAAILTIAGYSCNDTIVIYDRIRDLMRLHPNWEIEKIVNEATNQNLGRTILTTVSTLMTVLSLFILGGPVLRDFSLPLLIGFTVSIPSTLFVATPLVVSMEKRRLAKLHGHKPTGSRKPANA
jgi:preprotein translocase subunit SecF